jgi:hypothetical protein
MWDQQLIVLKQYITKYHKLPSTRNHDPDVVDLAKWYYDQQLNYSTLTEEYKTKWDDFMHNYYDKIKSNDVWKRNLEQLKEYICIYGKPPALGNTKYKKLSKWLQNQKQRIYMKDEYTKKLWDEFNRDYLITNDTWYDVLDKLKVYIDTNKEIPLQNDDHYEVRVLSFWLSRQKKYFAINQLKEEYKLKWIEFMNEYKEYMLTKEEEWNMKFEILKSYMDTHKEKPKQKVNYLGNWLYMQQQYYRLKKYNLKRPHIRKKWEEFNEQYKQYLLPHEVWMNKLKLLKEYIDIHQKIPEKDTPLYTWIKTQKKNNENHRLKEDVASHWKEFIDTYQKFFKTKKYTPKKHIWLTRLEEVKQFIDIYHEFPSPYHKVKEVRFLGKWLKTQHDSCIYNRFKNKSLKESYDLFREQYYTTTTYWKNALNNVKHYIRTYYKIPSADDHRPDVRGLHVWLNSQYNHYHRVYGLMKNEELRTLWSQFLIDHDHILVFTT